MFVVYSEPIEIVSSTFYYPIRVMNPSIGAISKWKYLLLLKLWWTGMQFAIFTTFLDLKKIIKLFSFINLESGRKLLNLD